MSVQNCTHPSNIFFCVDYTDSGKKKISSAGLISLQQYFRFHRSWVTTSPIMASLVLMTRWPGNECHLQEVEKRWVGRASTGTTGYPGTPWCCARSRGCRVGDWSAIRAWSGPSALTRHGRRGSPPPAGSPPHRCQRWRRMQRPVLLPDLPERNRGLTELLINTLLSKQLFVSLLINLLCSSFLDWILHCTWNHS